MTFQDLCLITESYTLSLVKGNYGKPMNGWQYKDGIMSYVNRRSNFGVKHFEFFLNRPDKQDSLYLQLNYFIQPGEGERIQVPAKHFQIVVPQRTSRKLLSYPNFKNTIGNRTNEASYSNFKFYLKNDPIQKIFPENELERQMSKLIKVNEYFVKTYGKEFSIIGDVYTVTQKSILDKLGTSLDRNIDDFGLRKIADRLMNFLNPQ